jgi:hypothetical protein
MKSIWSVEMVKSIKRFFITLRFVQNDNYLDDMGKGVGSGGANSNPITFSNAITCCHSERSIFVFSSESCVLK